ncbi:Xylulokinase [Caldicellulosiruptor kronotskyensis 2002]|uniref:Xylulokinase n=1 Tax=Caldicellulosiruptor kronotskyensis (strain DSM 18902 / VKM B-2412 / 2002) TaxID=632348 RepID=E4SEH2_CALK2|nr:FGGY-family carbohydrate kinase [Caldicellulosiruptor kronotskyensis]ADQ45459.1 Xylulokinase [Caldicellulosiruptor kronotskyensis 2002]
MRELLLGIDIGTSACKLSVFDREGNVIFDTSKPYNIYFPQEGFVEQDPNEWWDAVVNAINEMFAKNNIRPDEIKSIGIAGQSWSCIPVDKNGNVLSNTPIWMDTRSSSILENICDRIDEKYIFEVSKNPLNPTYSTLKILWFKENKPDVYKNTYKFLQSNSFIVFKLTNSFSQDLSQGYGYHFFNMEKGCYDEKAADMFKIELELLPQIYPCHEVVGYVSKKAASITGLKEGTPVVAGGLDAACCTLGAGVIEVGQTQEQGGQAGGMSICLDRPVSNPKLILSYHVVPGRWLFQGGTVGGGSLRWFYEQFGYEEAETAKREGKSPFTIMDEKAERIPCGSEGLIFLPYMAGERSPIWDRNAKGIFYGVSYKKTKAHFIRSIMEGCAYALRHNLEVAEKNGVKIDRLYAVGGAANSKLWCQIKSDVTGKIIEVPVSDNATTLGAAILAGYGVGMFKDISNTIKEIVKSKAIYLPSFDNYKLYSRYYEQYLEIYERLKEIMSR